MRAQTLRLAGPALLFTAALLLLTALEVLT